MSRNLFVLISLFFTSLAYGQLQDLTVADFQKSELFKYVIVDQAEKVFSDEQQEKDLYKVTYLVEGECAPTGGGDACELVPYCEYTWAFLVGINNELFIEGTQVSCDVEIEQVLKTQLKEI